MAVKCQGNVYIRNARQNIKGISAAKNIDPAKMAVRLGISRTTWYNRLKHPENITLLELSIIAKELGTTPEVLITRSITGG